MSPDEILSKKAQWIIDNANGFKLIFTGFPVRVKDVATVDLGCAEQPMYDSILDAISEEIKAVQVIGFERVGGLDNLIAVTNMLRERMREDLHVPLFFVAPPEIRAKFKEIAPDFSSWATLL